MMSPHIQHQIYLQFVLPFLHVQVHAIQEAALANLLTLCRVSRSRHSLSPMSLLEQPLSLLNLHLITDKGSSPHQAEIKPLQHFDPDCLH